MVLYAVAAYLPKEIREKGKSKVVPASVDLVERFYRVGAPHERSSSHLFEE